ncbi:FAD-binding domain-containing protein [Marasmius fiardii PR-910]|nr:FAD-binding domain-containing protein [Marasmius fiardii PR-910]
MQPPTLLLYLTALFGIGLCSLQHDLQAAGVTALYPGDSGYDTVSQAFNRRYTFRPAAIAFPTNVHQVSDAVKVGAANGFKVVARSGGHNYIANGLGGKNGSLVLDLSALKKIDFDLATNTTLIEPGNRLGDIALALNEYGRAIPHGTCSYVGVGGHAAGGGFGFVSRMWGLNLDAVKAAEIVLANGTITTVSASQNPDLFWGIRGAASSFGIITALTFQTYPAPTSSVIFSYDWTHDVNGATNAFESFQTFADSGIPPELGGELTISRGTQRDQVTVEFSGGYWGPLDSFNATIASYLSTQPIPTSQTITTGNWLEGLEALLFGALNTSTAPDRLTTFYAKSLMAPEVEPITDEAARSLFNYLANEGFASDTDWFVEIELYGGSNSAINSVPFDATAFAHRNSRFNFQFHAASLNGDPPFPDDGLTFVDGMASNLISTMPSDWDYGAYINYPDDRLQDWERLYYGTHWPRLTALKRAVDPHDVFSFPLSIEE